MSDFAEALAAQIPRLRRYARALTHNAAWSDDLVQDTLERALRYRWRFHFDGNLTAWLFTILYRRYLSDASRNRIFEATDAPEPVSPGDMGARLDMQRALARLSPEHRAVIVLVALEQLSYKEAAEVLDIPVGTLMSRLARGRERLRSLLSGAPSSTTAGPLTRIK